MDDQTEEVLIEVLAQLYEAEDESREIYGGASPKYVAARQNVEELLFPEEEKAEFLTKADRTAKALE